MNDNSTINETKPFLSINKLLKVLSALCIIFVFCPAFLVSCSGEDIEVSVMTAVEGLSAYGETVAEPRPIMLLCLLLPIVIIVTLFIKKLNGKKAALITVGCAVIDIIIWLLFKSAVKELAEENYCDFKVTGWYYINFAMLLIIIVFSFLVVINKLNMEKDLLGSFSNAGVKNALEQMSNSVGQMSETVSHIAGGVVSTIKEKSVKEDVIGYCSKCGKPIVYGCKFCMTCGTAVPENILAEAEAAKKAEKAEKAEKERLAIEAKNKEKSEQSNDEKERRCKSCGAQLERDSLFCETCGTKVE